MPAVDLTRHETPEQRDARMGELGQAVEISELLVTEMFDYTCSDNQFNYSRKIWLKLVVYPLQSFATVINFKLNTY